MRCQYDDKKRECGTATTAVAEQWRVRELGTMRTTALCALGSQLLPLSRDPTPLPTLI
jgi:hypothetical protein